MNNQTTYLLKDEFDTIPFVDIILPYAESFLHELEKINTSIELLNKLYIILLQELSTVAEIAMQEELESYRNNGRSNYQEFVTTTSLLLATKYPVLDKILTTVTTNYTAHIKKIFITFYEDFDQISEVFLIKSNKNNIIIKDIDTSLGDGHSGESTSLVTLSNGTKLIYKPRNIDTTKSYNLFINWVNHKLNTNLKTLKCVNCGSYGWLEFITYEAVNSHEELQDYYYKAGILLAVTLFLGSRDCHFENIIVSGSNPVLIDHETIIQPVLSNQSVRTWDEQHKVPSFSVLESMLIVNRDTGAPLEYPGYGIRGNVEAMDIEIRVINPNTIDSKRVTRFVFRKLVKENIPLYGNSCVFVNNYKNSFIKGFSTSYDMFMNSRDELLSDSSPVRFFENQEVRYVWRPTFIYFKILKYMRRASFMSSIDEYKSKLYELMSKAYKKGNLKSYELILDYEIKQMLNGDIPCFNLNSLDCHLEADKRFKVFRYNCIENIKHRIGLLSIQHKKEQLEYITKWLNI